MQLNEKITKELKNSSYWNQKTRIAGNSIQGLSCPVCGDKSAWAYKDNPNSINCNRLNSCGSRTCTLELFNIRQNIEKDYRPTKQDPHRPARVYLATRGVKATKGLKYEYWPKVRRLSTGAIMFPVGKNNDGKKIYNGRLLNPPPGVGKAHNRGNTSKMYWKHPTLNYDPTHPTWITEGILDALSLIEMRFLAIAVLAAGQDPTKLDLGNFQTLNLCFDNDPAGRRAVRIWKAAFPQAIPVLPDPGQDWNDILIRNGNAEKARKFVDKNIDRFKFNGKLALAPNVKEWAEIYHEFKGKAPGLFHFRNCTYFSHIKKGKVSVEQCGTCTIEPLSFLIDRSNPVHPEYRYQLKIKPAKGRPVFTTAIGRNLSTSRNMNEFFLTHCKQAWTGGTNATQALAKKITMAKGIPETREMQLTGYDIETRWYMFKHFAVSPAGKLHQPDKNGLYRLTHLEWAKPPTHAGDKAIKPSKKGPSVREIHRLITDAWGPNGAAGVAFTVASWFVNQIKEQKGFFPHASFAGDVQAGKSVLTNILNAIQGYNGEGLPISQLSTKKAMARSISRESGRFVALLEDNQRNDRAFDYSILLTAYNKGPLQLRAAFSNDNRTTEAPFQGALLFVQNTAPFNSKAEKERVFSLEFRHDALTDSTRAAHDKLIKIPLPALARVMMLTLQYRKKIEAEWPGVFDLAVDALEGISNRRIRENHAIILCFHRLFCEIHGIKNSRLLDFIKKTAKLKEESSAARDQDIADHFFEIIDEIDEEKTPGCLHYDEKSKKIFLNMAGIEQLIRNRGLQFTANDILFKALRRHPGYVKAAHLFRFPDDTETGKDGRPKVKRSWVFDATKMS